MVGLSRAVVAGQTLQANVCSVGVGRHLQSQKRQVVEDPWRVIAGVDADRGDPNVLVSEAL